MGVPQTPPSVTDDAAVPAPYLTSLGTQSYATTDARLQSAGFFLCRTAHSAGWRAATLLRPVAFA